MTEKVTYIAYDGTAFEKACDCIEYESKLTESKVKNLDGELCFFGTDGRCVDVTAQSFFDCDVDYICIMGSKGLSQMELILEGYGASTVRDYMTQDAQFPMLLMWDENTDQWVKMHEYISEAELNVESLKKRADTLMNLSYERCGGGSYVQDNA